MRTKKIEQMGLDLYNSLRGPLSQMESADDMDKFEIDLSKYDKNVIIECMKCAQTNIGCGENMKRAGVKMSFAMIDYYNNLIIDACNNAVNKEDNEMESKREMLNNMTVKELRAEAKAQGIEGMSRAKKDELIEALMNNKENTGNTIQISKVKMYAFTGMFIGEFEAEVQDGKILVNTTSKGELMFNLKTGKEIADKNKSRYANRVEAV